MQALKTLPVRILVADSDCRKLQNVFKFDADVNVLGMRRQVSDFRDNQVREDTARCKDDHQPRKSMNVNT